jgi:hypothetical protein
VGLRQIPRRQVRREIRRVQRFAGGGVEEGVEAEAVADAVDFGAQPTDQRAEVLVWAKPLGWRPATPNSSLRRKVGWLSLTWVSR